ncbi:hypothetical protein CLAFUW4_06857 [Fulvia fulva]|uniref:DUF7730 domain-containing protein n=1 Tax=Passalora fulva TaxID=5499 RepID=A0A9Q8PAF9_PASFU|nr:uncharacterized protein CLAFUR5_06995 [Fulvia fulva]KAK4621944.1 hypothetical protein CLAFUR4_06865 [Fulvia fulva]KAK4623117.1 hypothetical protein CLAFUR0_06862 [Fulvia fulva]UJO18862.1 hypothetical protein CLAFUR5_06995 [Fulvia fulva]WPV16763.1 hypothetical protein CLAFUW4_06857 [Fulvia fulva]WPV31314.1 hypothetical protein CLAFUW7_06856 [Fulvia fulva]
MDQGHYNCRDYDVSPHFRPTTIATTTTTSSRTSAPLFRHESFDELEQRSRSPASFKPKFPLLQLPLELRRQIFNYLLPRTYDRSDPNPLASHARNFSAVKKRAAKGMIIPKADIQRGGAHIVWQRANADLLRVCRQIHDECAEMLYGGNTFLLFLTYSGIAFRFNYLLPTGMAPSRRFNFLELMPKRYLALVKRVVVNVDHVDSYTGMIKFNVGGKGLTHGLSNQVRRLVNALQPPLALNDEPKHDEVHESGRDSGMEMRSDERRLAKVHVRVSNGNVVLGQIKSQREEALKIEQDVETMLAPFGDLRGVRDVAITGAVMKPFADSLRQKMMGNEKLEHTIAVTKALRVLELDMTAPQLCVYGNDI